MSVSRDTEYTIMRLSGLSTDDKPTDVKSGSWFREIDTGKEYMFDGTNWVEQTTGGGGGGGAMVVHFSVDGDGNLTADKTYSEILGAYPNAVGVAETPDGNNTANFSKTVVSDGETLLIFDFVAMDTSDVDISGIVKNELVISPDESIAMNQYTKMFD